MPPGSHRGPEPAYHAAPGLRVSRLSASPVHGGGPLAASGEESLLTETCDV